MFIPAIMTISSNEAKMTGSIKAAFNLFPRRACLHKGWLDSYEVYQESKSPTASRSVDSTQYIQPLTGESTVSRVGRS